jgi:hypothetical protein
MSRTSVSRSSQLVAAVCGANHSRIRHGPVARAGGPDAPTP